MDGHQPKGQRFSHVYLRPEDAVSDSPRLRMRLLKFFEMAVVDFHPELMDSVARRGVAAPTFGELRA